MKQTTIINKTSSNYQIWTLELDKHCDGLLHYGCVIGTNQVHTDSSTYNINKLEGYLKVYMIALPGTGCD